MEKVILAEKLNQFSDHWNPRVVGELNGQEVKVVKLKGPFVWHHHEEEDEMFLVLNGTLKMEFRDRTETIKAQEFIIIPKGLEHRPVAEEEVEVMLFEPSGTLNTGNVREERTRDHLEKL